jgi:predicted ATPase
MPIAELSVAGYRSIRNVRLRLRNINVLTGPNGCGKSNLYNAVFLLSKAARGGLGAAIAAEGGMPSVLYAGQEKQRLTRKKPPRRVVLSITTELFRYELQIGLPQSGTPTGGFDREGNPQSGSLFGADPEVKEESIAYTETGSRAVILLDRSGPTTSVRDIEGRMVQYPLALDKTDSVLSQIAEPHRYPELSQLHQQMRRWRFYHAFRTDTDSPLRRPRVGVITPVLDHDGADLAAALQTVIEIGDSDALGAAIDRAFGGARLEIASERTRFLVRMHMPGVLRPLEAAELSDGTLRFLCLCAALLSPRPPELLALNEPETSLHPDLIPPLARLMVRAGQSSQLWITTHSPLLSRAVEDLTGEAALRLELRDGETVLAVR